MTSRRPLLLRFLLPVFVACVALIAPAVFEASFVADLYGFAIGEVDWFEVAEHYIEADDEAV